MRTSRKRTIAIIVPVTVLALAGIATAAVLTTTSATLGGGSTAVSNSCTLKVSYDLTTDVLYQAPVILAPTSVGGYYLSNVSVTPGGQPDCKLAKFKVTIAKGDGTSIGEGTGTVDATGALVSDVPLTKKALAQDVGAAYATITNITVNSTGTAP